MPVTSAASETRSASRRSCGRLGSARVSRAGRGLWPRRTFLIAEFVLRRPDPRILFVRLRYPGIPWIPQDVLKLLLQITIRSYVAIEPLLLPNCSACPVSLV